MIILYLVFAALTIALNLGVFTFCKWFLEKNITAEKYQIYIKYFSKLAGIAAGFVVKYALDKIYVFDDISQNVAEEVKKVGIYGLFSVFTTVLLFLISEVIERNVNWKHKTHIAWLIGLIVGYVIKFFLDKTFVFN
jgi:putative flippase GtrA